MGQELAGGMQRHEGIDITTNREQHNNYQDSIAKDTIDDISFIMDTYHDSSLATSNSHNTATLKNSNFNLSKNNEEFKGLDKEQGDNLTATDGAKISRYVYKDDPRAKLPKHIKEIINEATLNKYGLSKKDLVNSETGFKSSVYINKQTGEVTYGIAGTDGLDYNDIKANLAQGTGLPTDAYNQAISNGVKFNNAIQKLGAYGSVTGHSLGGGEAAAISKKTGLEAKTYNAAGVHKLTVRNTKDKGNIDNYTMKHDLLTNLQNNNSYLPKALGRQHVLEPTKNTSLIQNIKDGHSIKTIVKHSNLKDEK